MDSDKYTTVVMTMTVERTLTMTVTRKLMMMRKRRRRGMQRRKRDDEEEGEQQDFVVDVMLNDFDIFDDSNDGAADRDHHYGVVDFHVHIDVTVVFVFAIV